MALEKDFELLDGYIRNKLSADDRAAFEQKLQADPNLKREYNLQQKIADGLRQTRVAELKSMLNNVPIPSSHGAEISIGVKTLVGLVAAGLVATGIYFFLDQKEEATGAEQAITKTEQPVEIQKETEPTPEPEINSTPSATSPQPEKEKEQPAVVKKQQAAEKETTRVSKPAVVVPKQKDSLSKPEINVFDPSEETENKATEGKTVTETAPKSSTKSSLTVKTDSKNKKYNFHYQFKSGELYLYGPFDKKLIEIMEFFSENKHTVFLFHENKYYLLNEANEKVKPLAAVSDPALIKKLKEHRGN